MKKRIISTIIALAVIITQVPWMALDVMAATSLEIMNKVSDADTTNEWTEYFGADSQGNVSTEFAGAVWTDKSVFAADTDTVTDKTQVQVDGKTFTVEDENFLVALSALSSTKEIVGYSHLPTDTVLVLDTSSSMGDDDIRAMVEAANAAITKLFATNNYNRVGIAIYNLNAYTLLPVDRYTSSSGVYLNFTTPGSGGGKVRRISVASGVKDSSNNNVVSSITCESGTYTQGGMQQGLNLFETVTDTSIETGNIQGGTIRIPVMVLMTDGDPTSGTTNYIYNDAENSVNNVRNIGDNNPSTTNEELVFLAQLTAANVHNRMEEHYGRSCLFYTLGLGVSGNYAPQVLQPQTTGTTTATEVDRLWSTYAQKAKGERVCTYEGTKKGSTDKYEVPVYRLTDATTGQALAASRYYTDRYFTANDADGLIDAFDAIVTEIILQSRYYPTLVSAGQHDIDGYVTVVDELGEHMEVKNIKGLMYRETLYTGANIIASMYNGSYGNAATWTELGWELVETIKERLDVAVTDDEGESGTDYGTPVTVTNDVVIDLLQKAWRDGQLGGTYNSANGTVSDFSNYISYYVNARGQYLGFHAKNHEEADYPAGTKYIGYSYIFSGNITGSTSSIAHGEMMHIVAQVYTNVTNDNVTVTWRVPASLIPQVFYGVTVNGDVLSSENIDEIKYTADTPVRFLYEVGVSEEITPINLLEIMTEDGAHSHPAGDGSYYFYSNRWGHGGDLDKLDPDNHKATIAYYNPSVENERYYYTEDTAVYYKDGENYLPYTGTAQPGSGYYSELKFIKGALSETGAPASLEIVMVPVDEAVASNPELTVRDSESGEWHIKKDTIFHQTGRISQPKAANVTETLDYVDYPVVVQPNSSVPDYEVYMFHGNNGRFRVMPAQGIKLTKAVDEVVEGTATDNFVFDITFAEALTDQQLAAVMVTDADYTEITEGVTKTNSKITVTLAKDQTVYITSLPTGAAYTITEQEHASYRLSSITNNGAGTVTANRVDEFVATNTEKEKLGSLVVTKYINHSSDSSYVAGNDVNFEVKINLGTAFANATLTNTVSATDVYIDGTHKTFSELTSVYSTTAITSATADENGVFTFRFGHMDSVSFCNLPEGTVYTVTETLPTARWSNQITYSEETRTIVADSTQTADVRNTYTAPESLATDFVVNVSKVLDGVDWADLAEGAAFSFQIEKYNSATSQWQVISPAEGFKLEIAKAAADTAQQTSVSLTADQLNISPTTIGTHHYRITEFEPDPPVTGITYDKTQAYFRVVVVDNNVMNDTLEYSVIQENNTEVTEDDVSGYTVSAQFTNSYDSTTANINLHKILENSTGVNIPMDEFIFILCGSEDCTGISCENAANHTVVTPSVNGDAVVPKTFTSTDSRFDTAAKEINTDYSEEADAVVTEDEQDSTKGTKTAAVTATEVETLTFTETCYITEVAGSRYGMDYSDAKVTAVITVEKKITTTYDAVKTAQVTRTENAEGETTAYGEWTEVSDTQSYTETEGTRSTPVITLVSSVRYYNDDDTVSEDTDTDATFVNSYALEAATAAVTGNKVFTGREAAASDSFTFEMYRTGADYTVAADAAPCSTATVPATQTNNEFTITTPEFTQVGTYYFVVKEQIPAAAVNNVYNGITYDNSEYRVQVVVEPSETDNSLVTEVSAIKAGGSATAVEFTNTYAITGKTSASLSVEKQLTGRELIKDEFTFNLYEIDGANVVKNGSSYVLNSEAQIKETVKNSANNAYNEATNVYTASVNFTAIEYTAPAVYEYVIVEDTSVAKGGVTYDQTPYVFAKVVVADNGDGTLGVESVSYSQDGTNYAAAGAIENSYTAAPVSVTLKGDKYYADEDNNKFDLQDYKEFKFALYTADDSFVIDESKAPVVTVNGSNSAAPNTAVAKDQFAFELNYSQKGTYYYVLKEETESDPTVIYDTAYYNVMVVVRDDNQGALTAIVNVKDASGNRVTLGYGENAEFSNIEKNVDPVTARFTIRKNIDKRGTADHTLSGFKFKVVKDGTLVTDQLVSGNDGYTYFEDSFNKADIGKTFVYEITEINTAIADMEYDTRTYTIKVTVNYVADQLVTSVMQNGAVVNEVSVQFNNTYSGNIPKKDPVIDPGKPVVITPDTGDISNNMLYIAVMAISAACMLAVFLAIKKDKKKEENAKNKR